MEELNAYQRYYQRNREAITARLREQYNPEAKKMYYTKNKEYIKEKMKEIYHHRKAEKNKALLLSARDKVDDTKRVIIDDVLQSGEYKTMNKRILQFLSQI